VFEATTVLTDELALDRTIEAAVAQFSDFLDNTLLRRCSSPRSCRGLWKPQEQGP
jgi:hypothetical protein